MAAAVTPAREAMLAMSYPGGSEFAVGQPSGGASAGSVGGVAVGRAAGLVGGPLGGLLMSPRPSAERVLGWLVVDHDPALSMCPPRGHRRRSGRAHRLPSRWRRRARRSMRLPAAAGRTARSVTLIGAS